MSEQVFADGIGPIVVVGGTVRFDLLTFVPDEAEAGGRPKAVVDHRVFMPVDAFLVIARRIAEASEAISKLEHHGAAPANRPAEIRPAPVPVEPSPPPPPAPAPSPAPAAAPSAERPKPPFP